jgi:hypothetical protein
MLRLLPLLLLHHRHSLLLPLLNYQLLPLLLPLLILELTAHSVLRRCTEWGFNELSK